MPPIPQLNLRSLKVSRKKKPPERPSRGVKLDWKDYVAFTIALLQTTLLPFVLLIVGIFIVALILLIAL